MRLGEVFPPDVSDRITEIKDTLAGISDLNGAAFERALNVGRN